MLLVSPNRTLCHPPPEHPQDSMPQTFDHVSILAGKSFSKVNSPAIYHVLADTTLGLRDRFVTYVILDLIDISDQCGNCLRPVVDT